jgi:4-amino-4-deoxy-L-arabinose transferase-like glycosyltransferase
MDKRSVPTSSSASNPTHAAHVACVRASRRHPVWFILVFTVLYLAALGLRLQAAWHRNHTSRGDVAMRLDGDEPYYERLAYGLLQGSFFPSPLRVPVYPAFIAATYYALGERSPAKFLYMQACVGVLVVPLTYLLARQWTGRLPALGAAGMMGLDDRLIEQAGFMYSEIVYTPLLLGALLALLGAAPAPRWGRFAGAGASMAVVTLCRPTTALFPLLLPLLLPRGWPWPRRVGTLLVYGLAMGAVIAPWTYHNWRQFHRFLPLNVGMVTLWQGSPEFYHLTQQGRSHVDIWSNELNPEHNGGYDPTTIEGDAYFKRRGLQSIRAEPGVYVLYALKKAGYLWLGNPAAEWGYGDLYNWKALRQWYPYSSLKLLTMFLTRQLPLVALVALVWLTIRGRVRPLKPLVVVCAYFTLVHMLLWAEIRYSDPLHPLLATMVMVASQEGYDWFARKRPDEDLQE